MDSREKIVSEYFELRVLLNKTNLRRDEKTEIEFLLRSNREKDFRLMAGLKKKLPSNTIEICRRNWRGRWEGSEYSGLFYLEEHCAKSLNKYTSIGSKASEIEAFILNLNKQLRNLGIPR